MNFILGFDMVSQFTLREQVIILMLFVWSLVWKGLALWKAARHGSKNWFIALLVINTLGILEILYIYIFSKKVDKSKSNL